MTRHCQRNDSWSLIWQGMLKIILRVLVRKWRLEKYSWWIGWENSWKFTWRRLKYSTIFFILFRIFFLIFCFQGCYLFPHLKFLNIKTGTGQQASSDFRPCESPEHAQVHSKVFRKLFDVFAKPRIWSHENSILSC